MWAPRGRAREKLRDRAERAVPQTSLERVGHGFGTLEAHDRCAHVLLFLRMDRNWSADGAKCDCKGRKKYAFHDCLLGKGRDVRR
jgi:hypothetical protein